MKRALVCQILKVPVFVGRGLLSLYSKFRPPKGVCCLHWRTESIFKQTLRRKTNILYGSRTQQFTGYWVNNWYCSFLDTNLHILWTGRVTQPSPINATSLAYVKRPSSRLLMTRPIAYITCFNRQGRRVIIFGAKGVLRFPNVRPSVSKLVF